MKICRQYKKMQGLGALRMRLGLTQEAFALELGISRSLVSKVENKCRTLPTPALVKLAALEIKLTEAGKTAGPAMLQSMAEEQAMKDQAALRMYCLASNFRKKADRLQHQLQLLESSYGQLRLCLQNVEWLLHSGSVTSGQGQGYLKMHRSILARKLTRCNLPMQVALRQKIALLRAAADQQQEP